MCADMSRFAGTAPALDGVGEVSGEAPICTHVEPLRRRVPEVTGHGALAGTELTGDAALGDILRSKGFIVDLTDGSDTGHRCGSPLLIEPFGGRRSSAFVARTRAS